MLEKILKFLPIYFVFNVMRYSIAFLQIPHSFIRILFVKPIVKVNKNYSQEHKFIFIYGSIEQSIGESSSNILNVIKELGGYVILVTNSSNYIFDEKAQEFSDVFIDNRNTGWDFSQYKRASNYIYQNLIGSNFSKVIYCNDSVFYLPKNLKEDISYLLDKNFEVIGLFDALAQRGIHFCSWCISINKNIFLDQKIQKFWNKFFEVKNKFYAIMEGELAFSEILFSLYPKTNVLYNGVYLCSLKEMNLKYLNYMSQKLHDDYFKKRSFTYEGNEHLGDSLRDFIFHNLYKYTPPQTFAPLLVEFYDFPFLKKDIFWNNFQSFGSLHFLCEILDRKIPMHYSNFIKAYFIKRGSLETSKSFVKMLNFLGIR